MDKFLNAEAVLRGVNEVNNVAFTRLVDINIKPQLLEVYNKLLPEIGYDKEVWYGDADVYVSIEEGYIKHGESFDILIIRNVVTCFDQSVVVSVINKQSGYIPLCKAVHPVGKKNGYSFNDHRDWAKEGLDSLREHNWSFGYEDLRDETLVFQLSDVYLLIQDKLSEPLHYNGWSKYSYGCGFHVEPFLFAQREIQYAYTMICGSPDYTTENK